MYLDVVLHSFLLGLLLQEAFQASSWGSPRPLLQLRQEESPLPPTHTHISALENREGQSVQGNEVQGWSQVVVPEAHFLEAGGIGLSRSRKEHLGFHFPLSEMPN